MTTKAEIRQAMLEKRPKVDQAARRAAGLSICARVIEMPVGLPLHATRICIYLSSKYEVPTRYIARQIWEAGRNVCVPAWSRSEKCYKLYHLDPQTPLVTGHYGIREPAVRQPVPIWDVGAFVVPGLAFDATGGRLGFGAGYYDKLLCQAIGKTLKIAICYDWQVQNEPLPQEPHDIPMDWVVTEKRALNCVANRVAMRTSSPS